MRVVYRISGKRDCGFSVSTSCVGEGLEEAAYSGGYCAPCGDGASVPDVFSVLYPSLKVSTCYSN